MLNTADTLSATDLVKAFKNKKVVNSASFYVGKNEIVGLLGPNGAGKTTSFYMTVGLLFPDSGSVCFDGEQITKLPIHKRARLGVSYLPQNSSIFRKMSVKDNLLAVMEIAGIAKEKRMSLCDYLLNRFSLEHISNSLGASLSGGERRRVEIARSLVNSPKYLLLDEPFAGIDPVTVQEIQKIIEELRDEGLGILITDHNVRETLGVCNRAYILAKGEIVCKGEPKEILSSELVKKIYLGEGFQI